MKTTFGPYFTPEPAASCMGEEVLPINLSMEWANSHELMRISIFRHCLPLAPNRIGLENLVFSAKELPRDVECQDYKSVQTFQELFLPLESLLAGMYRAGEITRPIFEALDELASLVPFNKGVRGKISASGLLLPRAEAHGYCLNSLYRDSDRVLVQLGWHPKGRTGRFHVCVASFRSNSDGHLDSGEWIPERELGVCEILSAELHRLIPGEPRDLLSEAGRVLITSHFTTSAVTPAIQG